MKETYLQGGCVSIRLVSYQVLGSYHVHPFAIWPNYLFWNIKVSDKWSSEVFHVHEPNNNGALVIPSFIDIFLFYFTSTEMNSEPMPPLSYILDGVA